MVARQQKRGASRQKESSFSKKQWPGATLAKVTAPTLLLAGDADGVAPKEVHATKLQSQLSSTTATLEVVPETSHQIMQEQPAAINERIGRFLQSLQKQGALPQLQA